ncbi:MAG: GerMN domain-containing protein [Candidatus Hydrogenedentota bacterium]|nr:MAG: GerMN domain-containing protein [Candidatus Hydrogenedentota bacterium]
MTKERSLKIALAVLWALVVLLLLGFGFRLLKEFILPPEQTVSLPVLPTQPEPKEREIRIYFADENAAKLVFEKRRVKLGAGASADAKTIMSELIKGPQSAELSSTIPAETRLLNAYGLGEMLVLDFTHELQTNHPGGSTGELLTVYSIVNTMTENLHGIEKVQILVEGEEIETLAGHMDLRKPLSPDKKWMTAWPGTKTEAGSAKRPHA